MQGTQPFPRLAEETELNLFRIAQEPFNNAAKHAQATHMTVTLVATEQQIRLIATDNGRGMVVADLAASDPPPGWGLLIIRERARAIGGQLAIDSVPGAGTTIIVEIER